MPTRHANHVFVVVSTSALIGIAAIILLLSATTTRHSWARAASSPSATALPTASGGASLARSEALVQDFVDAYNRHDINGVLATFDSKLKYFDCDYATSHLVFLTTKKQLRQWLRTVFEEQDTFQHAQPLGRNPGVVGFHSVRASSVIRALGVSSIEDDPKLRVNQHTKLFYAAMGGRSCSSFGDASQVADPPASVTKAVVQGFFDAYAGRDLQREAQLMLTTVKYRDCASGTGKAVSLAGGSQVKAWLRSRFHAGDAFNDIQAAGVTGRHANVATIHAQRVSRSLRQRGLPAAPVTVRVTISHIHQERISGVSVTSSGAACSGS